MSRNSKSNYDPATRTGHRNNINIQINFNVKDKNQAISGKKIDNYVQIEHKNNSKGDSYSRNTEEIKKGKKKQSDLNPKWQKEKQVDTPLKHRYIETNKVVKRSNLKTPERIQASRKEERSKSTNRKLVKRKNAKSVQNLRAGYKYTQNKDSPAKSSREKDKSRSRSKSSKKVIKSTQHSMKNLLVFQNTGIKTKLSDNKNNISKERVTSTASKRNTREEDHEKIRKYMEDKKKKEKHEDKRKARESKMKKNKLQQELKKVEAERRANASKHIHVPKDLFHEHRQRLPLNFESEDEFQESLDYEKHNKEASELIRESPPGSDPMKSISISKYKKMQQFGSSSRKKFRKSRKGGLVYRYLNNSISPKQLGMLIESVESIQRCWRGYQARKHFALKLSDESTKYRYIRNKMENKRDVFWSNQEDNSIVNVDKDTAIKVYESASSSIGNFHSNPASLEDSSSHHHSDENNTTDRFKKLSINMIEDEGEFQGSKERSEKQTYENSKMLKEIEQLRKRLDQQSMKYKSLEQQNQNLKANIEKISLRESRNNNSQQLGNSSVELIQIRMPKKIESPPNKTQVQEDYESREEKGEQKPEKRRLIIDPEGHFDVQTFKEQFQAFDCSSPSHSKIEDQLKQLKNKNVERFLSKKEVKLSQKYEKKFSMFDKMLQDKIVSPRTYNLKKQEIQERLRSEQSELKQKYQEAKNILGYFDDLSQDSEQEKKEQMLIEQDHLKNQRSSINKPSFKKGTNLMNSQTNTDPVQIPKNEQKVPRKEQEKPTLQVDAKSNSSYSSEDDRIYKKYWTDDIEQVHKHTIEITKKIQEALKVESEQSSKREEPQRQESSSESHRQEGYHSYDSSKDPARRQEEMSSLTHVHSKSSDVNINLSATQSAQQDYMEEIREMPCDAEKKARQIFNKINVFDDIECKSDEEEMDNDSHENICNLLNQRPLSAHGQKKESKESENLYVSEAEFNHKKRKEEELSRSSSFEKSNKSLSVNNSSHVDIKGFITNLTFIKQFCISICEFIRNNDRWKQTFIDQISKASDRNLTELLRAYRITIGGEVKNNYNTFTDEYIYPYFKNVSDKNPIINQQLFTEFLKVFDEEKNGSSGWSESGISKKTRQMREFFLISIIDTFNQALEFEKPGSVYGEPLPWLNHYKHLKNHNNTTLKFASTDKKYQSGSSSNEEQSEEERRLDQIFGTSIAKVIQWGSCLCGFIADPMPMEMGDSQIANLSEDQLNSIRENRVGLMLQKWLLEEEEEMTNSTPEYTEAILCLTEKIYESLVLEAADEFWDLLSSEEE